MHWLGTCSKVTKTENHIPPGGGGYSIIKVYGGEPLYRVVFLGWGDVPKHGVWFCAGSSLKMGPLFKTGVTNLSFVLVTLIIMLSLKSLVKMCKIVKKIGKKGHFWGGCPKDGYLFFAKMTPKHGYGF